jgi:hypothetical protein
MIAALIFSFWIATNFNRNAFTATVRDLETIGARCFVEGQNVLTLFMAHLTSFGGCGRARSGNVRGIGANFAQ